MTEVLLAFYILTGIFKIVLQAYAIEVPVDLTLGGAVLVILAAGYDVLAGKNRLSFPDYKGRARLLLPTILFFGWVVVTVIYSPAENYSLKKAFLIQTNLVGIVVPFVLKKFDRKLFFRTFMIISAGAGILNFIIYGILARDMHHLLHIQNTEIYQKFYLHCGYLLGASSIMALSFKNRTAKVMWLTVFFWLLFATAARAPILLTIAGIGGFLIYAVIRDQRGIKGVFHRWKRQLLLVVALNGMVLGGLLLTNHGSAILKRTGYRMALLVGKGEEFFPKDKTEESSEAPRVGGKELTAKEKKANLENKESITKRGDHLSFSIDKIFDSPSSLVFGYGLGSYNLLFQGEEGRGYPHNIFLESWFELGAIGLLLLLWFLFNVVRTVVREKNVVLLFLVGYLLLNALKSYSLVDHRIMFSILTIALLHAGLNSKLNEPGSGPDQSP